MQVVFLSVWFYFTVFNCCIRNRNSQDDEMLIQSKETCIFTSCSYKNGLFALNFVDFQGEYRVLEVLRDLLSGLWLDGEKGVNL